MANTTNDTASTRFVSKTATQTGALDTDTLQLLGLYGSAADPKAMVRLPSGRIRQVTPGSRLASGRVVAIDGDALILDLKGSPRRLVMPGR